MATNGQPQLPALNLNPDIQTLTTPGMMPDGTVSLRDFHAAAQGDAELAELMIPGITSPDGVMLLRKGQDGIPRVHLKTPQAKAKFAELQAQQVAAQSEAEYIPYSQLRAMPYKDVERFLPGIGEPGGIVPYLGAETASGERLVRNPQHPTTQKIAGIQRKKLSPQAEKDKMVDDAVNAGADPEEFQQQPASRMDQAIRGIKGKQFKDELEKEGFDPKAPIGVS